MTLLQGTEPAQEWRARAGRCLAVVAKQAGALGAALLTLLASLASVAALALLLSWAALHTGLR